MKPKNNSVNPKATSVIVFVKDSPDYDNVGMVMVFDEEGKQMPEMQGKYLTVKTKIISHCKDDAEFFLMNWNRGSHVKLTRQDFVNLGHYSRIHILHHAYS